MLSCCLNCFVEFSITLEHLGGFRIFVTKKKKIHVGGLFTKLLKLFYISELIFPFKDKNPCLNFLKIRQESVWGVCKYAFVHMHIRQTF